MEFNGFQNKRQLLNVNKLRRWKLCKFDEVLYDNTRKAVKIKKENYQQHGKYPIIDQGQMYIAGYTDNSTGLYEDCPVIIFGDHTRVIKYVDFPIFLGADGVKLLSKKIDCNMKYVFYFLKSVNLPSDGYSRHFKYLKQIIIPLPDVETQQKIADVLDKAQFLIDKRKEQIKECERLIESLFYDMFGNPFEKQGGFRWSKLGEVAEINPSKREISEKDFSEEVSFIPMENVGVNGEIETNQIRRIEEVYKGFTYFAEGDVLFAKITPCMENGKGAIARGLYNGIGFGSTEFHVLRPRENISTSDWVYGLTKLKSFRKYAEMKMTGSAGQKRVPVSFLKDIYISIPPIKLQKEFAEKVQKIELQKQLLEKSLALMEDNFNSLMQKAFRGELFS